MDPAIGLVITSTLAFALSIIALWKSTLTPFKLNVSYNSPTFTLYTISPDISSGAQTWWVPSIDTAFTFSNHGKRRGEITDIRFKGTLSTQDMTRTFVFYAKWIVTFPLFQRQRGERLKWVQTAIERDWYPLILAGDEQLSLHIIFEGFRWDQQYTGTLNLTLQLYTSEKDEWKDHETFEHRLSDEMYTDTVTRSLSTEKLAKTRANIAEQWDNID
ncbi:MAG: hypothetical protein NWE83_11320 [Candidatus Bathyarchaeota archaeon]|nr:hypothetical protein [Candidatus Bathyarchaeota archaeon]